MILEIKKEKPFMIHPESDQTRSTEKMNSICVYIYIYRCLQRLVGSIYIYIYVYKGCWEKM